MPSVANWGFLLILLQTVNASEPIVFFSVGSVRQLGSACRALFAPQRSLKLVSRTGRCSPASARVDVHTFAGSSTPSMPHPSHLGESTPFLRPPSSAATLQVWLARQCSGASRELGHPVDRFTEVDYDCAERLVRRPEDARRSLLACLQSQRTQMDLGSVGLTGHVSSLFAVTSDVRFCGGLVRHSFYLAIRGNLGCSFLRRSRASLLVPRSVPDVQGKEDRRTRGRTCVAVRDPVCLSHSRLCPSRSLRRCPRYQPRFLVFSCLSFCHRWSQS